MCHWDQQQWESKEGRTRLREELNRNAITKKTSVNPQRNSGAGLTLLSFSEKLRHKDRPLYLCVILSLNVGCLQEKDMTLKAVSGDIECGTP